MLVQLICFYFRIILNEEIHEILAAEGGEIFFVKISLFDGDIYMKHNTRCYNSPIP